MKNSYSIMVLKKSAGVVLGTFALETIIDNGGIISFIDVDRSLYDCRIVFHNKKSRRKTSNVLATLHIDFIFPEYDFKLQGDE